MNKDIDEFVRVVSVITKKKHPALYEDMVARGKYFRSRALKDMGEQFLTGAVSEAQASTAVKPEAVTKQAPHIVAPVNASQGNESQGNESRPFEVEPDQSLPVEQYGKPEDLQVKASVPVAAPCAMDDEAERRRANFKEGVKAGFDFD